MAQAMDVVCGMMVDIETAPAQLMFDSQMFYFCSLECRNRFEEDPKRYSSKEHRDRLAASLHNPHFPTPRFGSAGSGGAEFEPIPERDKQTAD